MTDIQKCLMSYYDKKLDIDLSEYKKHITFSGLSVKIKFGFFIDKNDVFEFKNRLKKYIHDQINTQIDIEVELMISSHEVQQGQKKIQGIKNIIAIASGKGGVGKSTVTSNIALSFAKLGAKVGILDADIYGPSQPTIMGNHNNPVTTDKKQIEPMLCHGIKMMSIGNLIDQDSAIIWRGPMVSGGLMQLLNDTNWGELDYLFIDLPPGTGDIQLTMTKKIPLTGAVIVTTPQDLSLIDANRAISMFKKINIHVFGIIENMSTYTCKKCGHQEAIFGSKGADIISKKQDISILGKLPLDTMIREDSDSGTPTVINNPDHFISKAYNDIGFSLAQKISLRPKINKLSSIGVKVE